MSVLFNGSLKQKFASGFAAAVLLSGAATIPGGQLANESSEAKSNDAKEAVQASDSVSPQAGTNLASNSDVQPGSTLAPASSSTILVHPHTIDGRQAATLFVKNIPVLTFIGTEVNSLSNSGDSVALALSDTTASLQTDAASGAGGLLNAEAEADPVLRATELGQQLDAEGVDAADLSVRWNEETDGYIVTSAGEDLVAIDSRTILADTTDDPAEDALQVTNRLRRLLGDQEPISEIEGLPEPEPEVIPAAQEVAIVSSNVGGASWYGPGFDGRLSASGEIFNQYDLTAAHRTLPFGTRVLVTNLYNGRQVTVRINDRGPYAGDRIIDLSAGAAAEIGLIDSGVGTVQLDILAY